MGSPPPPFQLAWPQKDRFHDFPNRTLILEICLEIETIPEKCYKGACHAQRIKYILTTQSFAWGKQRKLQMKLLLNSINSEILQNSYHGIITEQLFNTQQLNNLILELIKFQQQ